MQSSNATVKTDIVGGQSTTQTLKNTEQSNTVLHKNKFIEKLTDLSLINFIKCCVHSDFNCIVLEGNPNEEETYNEWCRLLSHYLVARSDKLVKEKIEIISQMEFLRYRIFWINSVVSCLTLRFTDEIASELRDVFSDYGFEFTNESFSEDIKLVKNIEVQSKITYDELDSTLKLLTKDTEKVTKEQSETDFYESVASYNRAFKTSEKVKDMNALEHAICCKALEKYSEDINLIKQNQAA